MGQHVRLELTDEEKAHERVARALCGSYWDGQQQPAFFNRNPNKVAYVDMNWERHGTLALGVIRAYENEGPDYSNEAVYVQ